MGLLSKSAHGCPAYAGMDPSLRKSSGEKAWLPRLRGDGPSEDSTEMARKEAAPPTRGWTLWVGFLLTT